MLEEKVEEIKKLCRKLGFVVASEPGRIPSDFYIWTVDTVEDAKTTLELFSIGIHWTVVDIVPVENIIYLRAIRPDRRYGCLIKLEADKLIEVLRKIVERIGG